MSLSPYGPQHDIACLNGASTILSCCTLVVEQLFLYSSKRSSCGVTVVNGGLGLVILGIVLLDKMNISPVTEYGTGRDKRVSE